MLKNILRRAAIIGAFLLLAPAHEALGASKKTNHKKTAGKKGTKPAAPQKPALAIDNRYQDIERLYTSMLTKKEVSAVAEKQPPAKGSLAEVVSFIKAAFAKNPYSLPQLDRPDLVFNLLNKLKNFNAAHDPLNRTAVTDRDVWLNLELFTNASRLSHKTVVGATKRTATVVGELIYTRMLLDPETNVDIIKQRQQFIRRLTEDDNLFEEISAFVQNVAKEEASLVSLMLTTDSMRQDQVLNYYNTISILPSAGISGALNLRQALSFFGLTISAAATALSGIAAVKFYRDFDGSAASALRRLYWISERSPQRREQRVTSDMEDMTRSPNYNMLKGFVPAAFGIYSAITGLGTLAGFGQMRREAQTIAYIKRRLSSINVLLQAVTALSSMPEPEQVGELKHQLDYYADTTQIELEDLAKRLDKTKFIPPAHGGMPGSLGTALAGQGDIANALIEAKKVINKASDGLILIGHLDAYLSVAKLLREHKNSCAPYCFVEFLEGRQSPTILAQDFHHPAVDENVVVTNSITLGSNDNPRNIMISGVNAGGKSTHMKAITLCCIFGQVFGIAPARSFSFTPFHLISTYLNITDDVSKRQSLFLAEMARAQTLLKNVNALPRDQFSFTLLDEVCTGTEPVEGAGLSFAISKKLGMYPNNILLLASHFPGLTELATKRADLYKNMKVVVEKDEEGEFVYPYGLYEGISNQQIAPDLLEKSGLPSVMTEKMRDVLNNPNRYIPTKE